ncbi:MAG: cobyrinate a,c-diamide synthase [Lachnospiraceae bacterium]|nr:cobyrinate a,c-diamide synthase [Lachnospiraceae bacterium]
MTRNTPRVVIAGTNSGSGKTTITCAILQALVNRGLKTAAFKCGPDYIDPMFHSRIIGARSSNLDLYFFDSNTARYLLAKNSEGCDLSVIEGVMGFYDGLDITGTEASTYDVARVTDSPVILVVNARGAALSVLAVIRGFLDFCPENHVAGVILNQCSGPTYEVLKAEIRSRFEGRVQPLGYMPKMKDASIESRHLGLVTAGEITDLKSRMTLLAEQAEKSIDIDSVIRLAESACEISFEPVLFPAYDDPVRIAVARDEAFCFYYEDSIAALEEMGAEITAFSPLHDPMLPDPVHGLYIGGGYPELYAEALAENKSMRNSVLAALERHVPCIAECGGFMYLTKAIGPNEMTGFLPGSCYDTGKLSRFGYVELTSEKNGLLCRKGESIRGHEFHYWDCESTGEDFTAEKRSGKKWNCVFHTDTLYAGFPHFHFYAGPEFALNFYNACLKEKHRND